MNRRIAYSAVIAFLLGLSGFAYAAAPVTIPNPISTTSFTDLASRIITQLGTLIASIGTVMLIVAGILYLTSAGNPEKINGAKKALIYAIIGIVVGLAASTLVAVVKDIIST